MPHVMVEISRNLSDRIDVAAMLAHLQAAAAEAGLPAEMVRVRATILDHYHIGDGAADLALAAIVVRVAPGRAPDALREIGAAIHDAAEAIVGVAGLRTHLTLEVQEIPHAAAFRGIVSR